MDVLVTPQDFEFLARLLRKHIRDKRRLYDTQRERQRREALQALGKSDNAMYQIRRAEALLEKLAFYAMTEPPIVRP